MPPIFDKKIVEASASYEKNPVLRELALIRLREWLGTQPHLPQVTDEMLKQFHHSCYYDLETTKSCIETYYTIRTSVPQAFKDRDLNRPELVQAREVMRMAILPEPDARGYCITYVGLKSGDVAKFSYLHVNQLYFMGVDSAVHRYGMMPGFVCIMDMKGAKLAHVAKCSLSLIKKFTIYTQDAFPVRLKETHIVNIVPWVDTILTLVRPFLRKDVLNSLHFHTTNSESLYEYVPRKYLPQDLGGSLPTLDTMEEETYKYLKTMQDFFTEEEKYRIDESKRGKNKKNTDSMPGTSLKDLEID